MNWEMKSRANRASAIVTFGVFLWALGVSGCSPAEPPAAEAYRKLGARNVVVQDGKLIELNLSQAAVTDADLAKLAESPELIHLDLGLCTKLTDAGLEHVAKLPQLETLTINSNPTFTDAGIAKLATLKRLKFLDIGQSKLTNESLATVAQLPALEKLNIGYVAGMDDEGIKQLDELKQLNEIWLPNTGVTAAGAEHLAKVHPDINVHGLDDEEDEDAEPGEDAPSGKTE